MKKKLIVRDISWLSFNARVLQEAADSSVPIKERIRFLGIFSNNLDEFFRVRVATLTRMKEFGNKTDLKANLEKNPKRIIEDINQIVLTQQNEFNRIWNDILLEMKLNRVYLKTENQLTAIQKKFIKHYFDTEVRSNIIPLMIESIPILPNLREKSIFLAVQMSSRKKPGLTKFAIIEVPHRVMSRFVILPRVTNQTHIILLEDVIRFNLKSIFIHTDFNQFESWIFKVTRDAEIDFDTDLNTTFIQKIEAGLKKRKKGRAVRLAYDKEMDMNLYSYLVKWLNLTPKDNVIPGGRIHNFRHFMDFPDVFPKAKKNRKIILHPAFKESQRVSNVIFKKDILLSFPFHSFDTIIDLLREAAMDDDVKSIQITAYRLASNSKVMNALINAARNGKQVTVMLELRARFDEEANLEWKTNLEEEGIRVLFGFQQMKVHAKICVIRKKMGGRIKKYGFISTGNLNEKTAKIYTDTCLLTSNVAIMTDIERIFRYLAKPKDNENQLDNCTHLITCPNNLRLEMSNLIDFEIKLARKKEKAEIMLKMNSLSDEFLINKLYEAARFGVAIKLIIRGIICLIPDLPGMKEPIRAISIVDEYLEHSRIFAFNHGGRDKIFLSSADWMVRNLDHRIETTCPINNEGLKKEIKDILKLQWSDNVKARILDNDLLNNYKPAKPEKKIRSQIEIMNYLSEKT